MSGGRRMSTWLAGRKTLTPMLTSRPPLILRVTVPVTTSPSCTVSMTFSHFSIFSALRLLRTIMPRSSCRPAMSSTSSSSTWISSPISANCFAVFPFVAGDDAFALVADVDQHEIVVDPQHLAFDDLVLADILAAKPGHVVGQRIANRDVPIFVRYIKLTN